MSYSAKFSPIKKLSAFRKLLKKVYSSKSVVDLNSLAPSTSVYLQVSLVILVRPFVLLMMHLSPSLLLRFRRTLILFIYQYWMVIYSLTGMWHLLLQKWHLRSQIQQMCTFSQTFTLIFECLTMTSSTTMREMWMWASAMPIVETLL